MVKSVCGIKEGYSKKTELSTEIILLDAQAGVVRGGTDRGSAHARQKKQQHRTWQVWALQILQYSLKVG